VTSEEIARQPVVNPLEALQGEVAGVIVTNVGSYATSTVKVEIRGRNTINPNFPSDPLYIIDGVPLTIQELTINSSYAGGSQGVIQSGIQSPATGQSPFFSMDPNDIESIEVLKDADATAIYGSRGSNGRQDPVSREC
jgi:TonB-dependent SusC/RagA subfamily outer membrane receptor